MTVLPAPFKPREARLWRLDATVHAATWDSGEGSYRAGGRWNSPGNRVVYAALDPATAILEVAVHKTFRVLDTVPHTLTSARLGNPSKGHVVEPDAVPNANWLIPGFVSTGQQAYGDALLRAHRFVVFPSVVSIHSWNIAFLASTDPFYDAVRQESFALDPRLHVSPTNP